MYRRKAIVRISSGPRLFSALVPKFLQIFLRHDANLNATLGLEYPLDRLVAVVAEIPYGDESEQSYLQAIETLIAYGAMLGRYKHEQVDAEGYYHDD